MGKTPLVSICIPAYNSELYIEQTLSCLCNQSYSNIEIIVVNDGSSDDTKEIVEKFNDKRISLIDARNGGACKARNTAFSNSKGDYIIFFDADDYVTTDFVQSQVNEITNHGDGVVLAAWGRFYNDDLATFTEELTPRKSMSFKEWIAFYWHPCNPMTNPGRAIMGRKTVLNAGLWNEELTLNDDLEFFTRIFLNADQIIFNEKAKFYYRSGIKGLSSSTGKIAYQSLYDSVSLAIDAVIAVFGKDEQVMLGCANMLQSFIYLTYPNQKKLLKKANDRIANLTTPNHKFQSGGITSLFSSILGWKITKRIKIIFNA